MTLNGNSDETNGYYSVIKNGVASNINLVKAVLPPIGVGMPWFKTIAGVPALPDGFVECNGQVLSDSDSPLNGETIPNLNGDNRFLRGNSTSGGTGGTETKDLQHTHSVTLGQQKDTASNGSNGGYAGLTNTITSSAGLSTTEDIMPPYYNVVWIMRIK